MSATAHLVRLFLILSLAGCATQRQLPDEDLWRMTGKLSVVTKDDRQVLGIVWGQSGGISDIVLSGPLGVKVARISATSSQINIDTGREMTVILPDDPVYLSEYSAIHLPWRHIRAWIRGKSTAGALISSEGISEDGWLVRVLKADKEGPRLMVLEHPDISLRLKVLKWQLNGPETATNGI